MKISELIDCLIEIENEHGEVDIEFSTDEDGLMIISLMSTEVEYLH